MVSNKWLIENLDAEIAKFDESAYVLPSHQLKALETCLNLITEDPDKAAQFSKPRRNAREHARTALKDIFSGVAPEVFLLCSLSTSISRLAKVAQTSLVPDLRKWWKTTSCPQGLVDSARLLCENYSIPELVGGMKKRPEEVPEPTSKLATVEKLVRIPLNWLRHFTSTKYCCSREVTFHGAANLCKQ